MDPLRQTARSAAHHEAAHAVLAARCRSVGWVEHVWVGPMGGEWVGETFLAYPASHCLFGNMRYGVMQEEELEIEGVIAAAGRFGHRRVLGLGDDADDRNFTVPDDLTLDEVSWAWASQAGVPSITAWRHARLRQAEQLVAAHWTTIQRVALALLDTAPIELEVHLGGSHAGEQAVVPAHFLDAEALDGLIGPQAP